MPQLIDAARKRSFLGKLWALTAPYFTSKEAPIATVLMIVIVAIVLALVYVNYLLNTFYGDFNNMLQVKNLKPTPVSLFGHTLFTVNYFVYLVGKFTVIVVPAVALSVYRTYLTQMLSIRWRRWMTEHFIDLWLENRAYYRLQIHSGGTDNPEQRIEADIASFTNVTLQLIIGIIGQTVTLITFVSLLWVLSGTITLPLFGMEIAVPGYMVWIAVIYAGVGTYFSYKIGRRLVRINFEQEKYRASFRFGMSRLKENAESVALYGGEADERHGLLASFAAIWTNWWALMRMQKRLNWFQSFYGQAGGIFPILVIAPRYFAGAIDFGTIFRVNQAFAQVANAMTWFMDNFVTLTEWKATVNRLIGFIETMEHAKKSKSGIAVGSDRPDLLEAVDLHLALPDGRTLIEGLSAKIGLGDRVLISGISGSGKTTLFRALAGIWPFGKGHIHVPADGKALFLPQRPYIPLGTLRHALTYPAAAEPMSDTEIRSALDAVHLEHLKDRLDQEANWSMALSIGEQQRLAIARALLLKPDWLYLDEATSALDAANEQRMYELLVERLPNATVLSIAHRPELAKYHDRHLHVDPETRSAKLTHLPAE